MNRSSAPVALRLLVLVSSSSALRAVGDGDFEFAVEPHVSATLLGSADIPSARMVGPEGRDESHQTPCQDAVGAPVKVRSLILSDPLQVTEGARVGFAPSGLITWSSFLPLTPRDHRGWGEAPPQMTPRRVGHLEGGFFGLLAVLDG